tara:strand:- start:148270 stop:148908 length:639 start_codon:yes stop_codon:yes gene_type:complete
MLEPHRDGAELEDRLVLNNLPCKSEWDGRIAYLDRDGVINLGSQEYVNSPEEVKILPNAGKAIGQLRRSGFRVVVVTNQSPLGRGLWDRSNLEKIHDKIKNLLIEEDEDAHLDLILYSPYAPWEGAWARKPNPGMLEAGRQLIDAASKGNFNTIDIRYGDDWLDRVDESNSVMVGDRDVDMAAAFSFGVRGFRCDPELGLADVVDLILEGAA